MEKKNWQKWDKLWRKKDSTSSREDWMKFSGYMGIFVLLLLVWIAAFFVFHIANFLVHLLLFFALVALALHFLWGGKKNELSRPRGE